jgi:hypothetical protein
VVQIWPGLFVCKQVTVCPGHIWTTLYVVPTVNRNPDLPYKTVKHFNAVGASNYVNFCCELLQSLYTYTGRSYHNKTGNVSTDVTLRRVR